MEHQNNTNNKRPTVRRTSAPSVRKTRTAASGRNSLHSNSRPKTANGEPMSRDELRSLKNMERRKKHRRNQLIGYGVAIVVVIIIAIILSITVFFKISSISIVGDEIYSSSEIVSASKLKKGDNLFTFSKADVSADIERKLPYVENVEIKRSLTGKVIFEITAAKAELAVDRGDSYILLSRSCKVLEENIQVLSEDTTIIVASELVSGKVGATAEFENENDVKTVVEVARIINEKEIKGITEIDITDYSEIKLGYNQRITLKIGTVSTFEKNVDFIKATLEKIDIDEPYFSGVIDFTIENKAYINDGSAEATTEPESEPKTDKGDEAKPDKNNEATTEKPTEKTTVKPVQST